MRSPQPVPSSSFLRGTLPIVAERAGPATLTVPPRRAATHDYAVLLLIIGGRSRVEQRGEWTLRAGDALVVPAGQAHRVLEMSGSEYWGVGFRPSSLGVEGAAALLEPLERVRDGAAPVVRIPSERQAFLEGLFRELRQFSVKPSEPSPSAQAVCSSLLTLVLAEVERVFSPAPPLRAGGGVVVESLRYIERHCLRPLSLADVAKAVGRSPSYVTASLSRATGLSAGEWIISGRMAEARRLLLYSEERLDAIAERIGYADVTHFIRMFRRAHGATPAAWRAARCGA